MRFTLLAGVVLLAASQAFATVGGGDITFKSRGGDVLFSHENHVSASGQKCTSCHDKLYTNSKKHKKNTMKEMQKAKSCGSCHNGTSAFSVKGDCAKCHKK